MLPVKLFQNLTNSLRNDELAQAHKNLAVLVE
jgi:hypothetical protein